MRLVYVPTMQNVYFVFSYLSLHFPIYSVKGKVVNIASRLFGPLRTTSNSPQLSLSSIMDKKSYLSPFLIYFMLICIAENREKGQKDARYSPMSDLLVGLPMCPQSGSPGSPPRSWSLRNEPSGETSHRYTSPPLRAGTVVPCG